MFDQRGMETAEAVQKAKEVLRDSRSLKGVFWVYRLGDTSAIPGRQELGLSPECEFTQTTSLGLGLAEAQRLLSKSKFNGGKYIVVVPTALLTMFDLFVLRGVSFDGIQVLVLDISGNKLGGVSV